jgi:hypothetical protein
VAEEAALDDWKDAGCLSEDGAATFTRAGTRRGGDRRPANALLAASIPPPPPLLLLKDG